MIIDHVLTVNKKVIHLSDERWLHITDNHNQIAGLKQEVLETVYQPDFIAKGNYMEKTVINNIYSILPNLLTLAKKQVWFDYDNKADVLYVSFRRPQDAVEMVPLSDDLLLRQREGEMVGLTILHASNLSKNKKDNITVI